MIIIGMYRPPKTFSVDYKILLESELGDFCNWASLQSNFMVILGDLNLDKLRPDKREEKLLNDMEMQQGLECLISKPTRTETRGTKTSSTLIDAILSNQPELFIPIKMMKIGASELPRPLSVIFNTCIEEGKRPTKWKKGEWTPVFKMGDRCMKENYRPVTVLS